MTKYQCYVCNKNFKQKSQLDYHTNRKYKCQPEIMSGSQNSMSGSQNFDPGSQQLLMGMQNPNPVLQPSLIGMQNSNSGSQPSLIYIQHPNYVVQNSSISAQTPIDNIQIPIIGIQNPNPIFNPPIIRNEIQQNTAINLPNQNDVVLNDDQILNDDYTCNYCNKSFMRNNALRRHIKYYCKVVIQENKIKQEIFEKLVLLESKNKQLEEELKNKDKQDKQYEKEIKKLKNEAKTNQTLTINNNSNNNNNNTTNNIINVNVVPHGEEDLSKYSNLLLVLAAKRGINAVLELTDRIHFNSQLPEFQNVYIPDIKNKHAMVFDKVWELKNTDDVISNIYDAKSDFIRENKDVFFNYLSPGEKIVYDRWATADNNRNTAEYKVYINSMHDKLKLLLYNKREMVMATKKLQKNNKKMLQQTK